MAKAPAVRGYHHGDARNALVTAAGDLLEHEGAAGLSLRQVAERAGLSRQAPYNHFADKETLLAALVLSGFERLEAALRSAAKSLTGNVALAASAEAYIGFAQGSPALFRLMFARELVDLSKFPDAGAAAAKAFGALVAVIEAMSPADLVEELSLAAWCLVHGYATLCNEAAIEHPDQRHARSQLFATIISASTNVAIGPPSAEATRGA